MDYNEYKNFKENTTHGNTMLPFEKYFSSIPNFFPFYPLHWHDEIEVIYVKNGHGTVTVNLTQYMVQTGDIVFISPGLLHSIGQFETEYMDYDTLVFHTSMLISYPPDACSLHYLGPLQHNELFLPVHIAPDDLLYPQIQSFIVELIQLYETKPSSYELKLKSYLLLVLHTLFSNQRVLSGHKVSSADSRIEKLKQIIKYIEDNYQKELYINDIAELCGFSSSHFMKFFKSNMGLTFTQYINDYRLNQASLLLTTTDLPILDIAFESGYDNLSYFNRIFKNKFHMTPKAFRKHENPSYTEF